MKGKGERSGDLENTLLRWSADSFTVALRYSCAKGRPQPRFLDRLCQCSEKQSSSIRGTCCAANDVRSCAVFPILLQQGNFIGGLFSLRVSRETYVMRPCPVYPLFFFSDSYTYCSCLYDWNRRSNDCVTPICCSKGFTGAPTTLTQQRTLSISVYKLQL